MRFITLIILSIVIIINKISLAEDLKCEYLSHYSHYYCKVLNILEADTSASNAIGSHKSGKGNLDVDVLFISTESSTKYVPSTTCIVFKNLNKFGISGRFLEGLTPEVFSECKKVDGIKISHLKLKEIDESLLSEVPNLETISITFTNIEILPKKLFKNNQKLTQINLSYNKFKAISTEFPVSVSLLSLQGNTCIDDIYVKEMSTKNLIINFIKKVYNKCKNETFENFTIEQVKTQLLGEKIEKNKDEILDYDEYFQTSKIFTQNKNEMNIQEVKTEKENVQKSIENLSKMIEKLKVSLILKNNLSGIILSNLTEEFKIINIKLDENSYDNQKISNDFNHKLNHENRLTLALFCFQIALAIVLVFLIYMRKF